MAEKEVRIKIVIDGIEKEVESVGELKTEMDKLGKSTSEAKKEGVGMQVVEEIFSKLPEPIQSTTRALGGMIRGLKGVKAAIAGTGIGLLVVALGSLASWLATTTAGFEALNNAMATLKALGGQIVEAFARLAQGDFAGAYRALADELVAAVNAQKDLVRQERELAATSNQLLVENAQLNKSLIEQQAIVEDGTKTIEERVAAQNQLFSIQSQIAQNNINLAKGEEALIARQKELAITEVERIDLEKQLNEAKAARIDAEAELVALEVSNSKTVNDLQKERIAILEEVGAAIEDLNLELIGSELNRQLVTLDNDRLKYRKQLELAGASAVAIEQLEETYRQRRIQLETEADAKIAEVLEAAQLEQSKKELDRLRAAAQQRKNERDAELKNQLATLEAFAESERLFNQEIANIEEERIRGIKDRINLLVLDTIESANERAIIELNFAEDAAITELELLEATEEEKLKVRELYSMKRRKLEKENQAFILGLTKKEFDGVISAASVTFNALAEFTTEGSRLHKAAKIASTVIDTYAGVQRALADLGPIGGAIASAVIIATGLANVAKIINTPIPGGNGGGTGGFSAPAVPTLPPDPTDALRQLQNQQAVDQEFGIQQRGSQAQLVRAYVVTEDINRAQEIDRKIKNLSRL